MAFSIKDENTDRVVRELAGLLGESYTRTVFIATQEKLDQLKSLSAKAKRERKKKMQAFLDSRKPMVVEGWDQKKVADELWEL